MLSHIIRREIQGNITSPKFVFTFILCTVLILVSVYTGATNYRADLKEHGLSVALSRKALEMQPSWLAIQNMKSIVPKPPTVLSAVAVGIQDAVGRNITLDYTRNPKPIDSKYDSNPVFAIFGPLDLTLIVKIVLSLFAILFAFDAIAGEKEKGTLKLTLSNPVPRDRLILGKAIGGFVSLILPLAIPFLMGLILLNIFPDVLLTAGDWIRLGIILLCFLLYLSVFFNLGLFISSRTHRSSSSLFVLLFIWVVFIFIIPKAAAMVSRQFVSVPSAHALDSERRAFSEAVQTKANYVREIWFKENPYPRGGPAFAVAEWWGKLEAFSKQQSENYYGITGDRFAELDSGYQARRRSQQELALNLSRFSPASAMVLSVLNLAKTGTGEHERFLDSVKTYQTAFGKWVGQKAIEEMQGQRKERKRGPDPPRLDGMPLHTFDSQSLGGTFSGILLDVCIMVLMNIVLFVGAYVSFLKYDVR